MTASSSTAIVITRVDSAGYFGVALITFVAAGLVYRLLFSFLALVWLRWREQAGR